MTGFSNVSVVRGGVRVPVEPGGPAGGDLTGSYKDPVVAQIQQYPIDPRSPANGDTLIFNGGEWIPTPSPTSTTYFQGVWDANTNTPDIANFPGLSDGFVWIVGAGGNTNVGGITDWIIGDYAVYSGGDWYKLSASSFGWLLQGNNGTNPTINFIGTADAKDLSIRANSIEGLKIYTNGNVRAAADLTVTGNITGSNAKLTGDLAVCGGDITSNSATFNLLAGVSTALNIGNSSAINTVSGQTKFPQGLSGSITRLTDGTSYLIAGTNMTIVTNSNGSITATAIPSGSDTQVQFNDGGSVFGANSGFTYNKTTNSINVSGNITGSNERLSGDLAINGGNLTTTSTTFNLVNSSATTINFGAGAISAINIGNSAGINIMSGATKFPQGLSGSLTKLTDGTSYIAQGQNIAVTTASNGSVNVAFSAGTPTTNDVLLFNGTSWAPSSIVSTLQTSYQTVSASEAIAAGDVCYIVNSGGSSAIPQVARAQANSLATVRGVLGLASGSIAKNGTGFVQTYGQLVGPVDTNTFSQGDPLFVSPTTPGGVTNVKPQGPNYAFQIGIVTRQGQPAGGGNAGIVFVSPIMQTDTRNLSDIVISTSIEHDVLTYDPATLAWKNKQPLWVPNTQTAVTLAAGATITTANFNNVTYLPIKTQGGANITLNATAPIAALTKTDADYGRELWLYNADNNRNISIPSGGTVKLETAALVGGNLVLVPGAIVKFLWTGIGGNGSWIQTSKVLVVA